MEREQELRVAMHSIENNVTAEGLQEAHARAWRGTKKQTEIEKTRTLQQSPEQTIKLFNEEDCTQREAAQNIAQKSLAMLEQQADSANRQTGQLTQQ